MSAPDLTPTEARWLSTLDDVKREHRCSWCDVLREEGATEEYIAEAHKEAEYDLLAARVTWPALLAAGERAGKVRKTAGYSWDPGFKPVPLWRLTDLTDPEAAP